VRPEELLGKTVLVGLTYASPDGDVRERRQMHGVIESADDAGVGIREPSGALFTLPPGFDAFEVADPGEYTLRGTGEVVVDPDLLCSWTITAPPSTLEDWTNSYEQRRSLYEAFADRLRDLLEELFDAYELDVAWDITFHATGNEMRRDLLQVWRTTGAVPDPFDSDVRATGVTVALPSIGELGALEHLVETEFVVDRTHSRAWAECNPHSDGSFAAELPTYLVELDERRAGLAEWAQYIGLKLRIEAVTEIGDAWRDALESLPLREPASYPTELQEVLTRQGAAMREADADLAFVHTSLERLLDDQREAVVAGDLEQPLNAITLMAYLHVGAPVTSLVDVAAEVGFRHDPDDLPGWASVEEGLLWLLRHEGVETIAEIDLFLSEILPRAPQMLAQLCELSSEAGFRPWTLRESLLEFVWLVFKRAPAETVALTDYMQPVAYALNTLIGNFVEPREQDT
jgi:hypothetical protein